MAEFATAIITASFKTGKPASEAASFMLESLGMNLEDLLSTLMTGPFDKGQSVELMKALMTASTSTKPAVKTAAVSSTEEDDGSVSPGFTSPAGVVPNYADSNLPARWGDIVDEAPKRSISISIDDLLKSAAAAAASSTPAPHVVCGDGCAGGGAAAHAEEEDEKTDSFRTMSHEELIEVLRGVVVEWNNSKKPTTTYGLHLAGAGLFKTRGEHFTKPEHGYIGVNLANLKEWAIGSDYMSETDVFDTTNARWTDLNAAAKQVMLALLKDRDVNTKLAQDWAVRYGGRGTRLDFSMYLSSNAVKLCD
jgi:hypothetical protein